MSINDRIKIFKQGSGTDVLLSRQSFLNCGESYGFGSGCGGGDTVDIYGFMVCEHRNVIYSSFVIITFHRSLIFSHSCVPFSYLD